MQVFHRSIFTYSILSIFLLFGNIALGQKYDFVNFTIEHGLVQSQVNNIIQDHDGMLWVSTLGGLSRFDGKEFYNYNYGKGLLHSLTERVFADKKNNIWIGSNDGLQSFDGIKFKSYEIEAEAQHKGVYQICQAADQSIYILASDNKLYKLNQECSVFEKFADTLSKVTAVITDSNAVYVSIFKKGIFKLDRDRMTPIIEWRGRDTMIHIRCFEHSRFLNGIWALGNNHLYWISDNTTKEIPLGIKSSMLSIEEASAHELYIGTIKGAYKWSLHQPLEYLGLRQGLSDNAINDITSDAEGNTWFGTNGNGMYRYHDRSFTIYDQSTGMHGNIVMALVNDSLHHTIWAGTLEGGLNKIANGTTVKLGDNEIDKINCLTYTKKNILWIGTIDNGLWIYENKRFTRVGKGVDQFPLSFNAITELSDGSVWIAHPRGILRLKNNKLDFVPGIKRSCYSIYELNKDSIVVGTSSGLMIIHSDLSSTSMDLDGTKGFLIGSIYSWKNYLLFGTSENGLIFWNKNTRKSFLCNESSGLTSNMTFSILCDNEDIYTGTINGLNKINVIDDGDHPVFKVTPISSSNQKLGPECNQNSILKTDNGTIMLGTTNGIYQYDPEKILSLIPPKIYLKSINIFSRPMDAAVVLDSMNSQSLLSPRLILSHTQNHLTFNMGGLHLSAPDKLKYQYCLIGADTSYTVPSPTATVIYPTLAPGYYTFKAKALVDLYPALYSDELSFSFIINPPYYQKNWFRFALIATLILFGALIQQYRIALKNKQLKLVEEVRKQEQLKIQQRTSEDLHDDLGNKITRLSLLTDILQTKLHGNDDENKILTQIRENIQGLYMGTKDIIWALAPNHNSLYDAMQRIIHFGSELFQDSSIYFKSGEIDPSFKSFKPPFEFSRNIIMISKEALHNILKHSGASLASIEFYYPSSTFHDIGMMRVEIKDDGTGIINNNNTHGNGIENIKKRIERIGGTIQFIHNAPHGTHILIEVKIPQTEG